MSQRPPADDDGFSDDEKPTSKAALPALPKPPKSPKPPRGRVRSAEEKSAKPAPKPTDEEDEDGDEESSNPQRSAEQIEAEHRKRMLTGNAEPLKPTPEITAIDQAHMSRKQREKKVEMIIRKARKQFPELDAVFEENENLKAQISALQDELDKLQQNPEQ